MTVAVDPQERPLGRGEPVAPRGVAAGRERGPNVNAVDGVHLESDTPRAQQSVI